ncbi:hypothetical protein [Mesorhizobium sp. 8]|jgi:hypothetical protein|uniref:hypothetical protein n=1 Tax=Mesorhizobium sp. 8 TaxID=2584466 RepID=UPI00111F28DD|nr:hypothetical protein [Mesorhizobium sp. 8]QDC00332.1 hypothetical protein FGU64_07825 [Mesorhizobium sp. 8]
MRISVQPAKRNDRVKIIFDRPMTIDDVQIGLQGGASLLVVAGDLYNSGSRFRYTLDLTADEVGLLISRLD